MELLLMLAMHSHMIAIVGMLTFICCCFNIYWSRNLKQQQQQHAEVLEIHDEVLNIEIEWLAVVVGGDNQIKMF